MRSRTGIVAVAVAGLLTVSLPVQAQQPAGPAPGETLSQSYRGSQSRNVEYQKVAPFKVFDNLYYVGIGSVAVWLIKTDAGLILVDSAQEPWVEHVIASIRKLGFDPKDIKYVLLSHGHLDHFGGAGRLQEISGARIATMDEDWKLIEDAYKAKPNPNRPLGVPIERDMVIKEGDKITLGTTTLDVYKLSGHTAGSPSFRFTVLDNGKPYKAFIFGGPGPRNGVEGGTEFLNSIHRLQKEFSDIEAPIHVHSWLNSYPVPGGGAILEPSQKLATRKPGDPHPFVGNAAWKAWLVQAEKGAMQFVADAKAGKPAGPAN